MCKKKNYLCFKMCIKNVKLPKVLSRSLCAASVLLFQYHHDEVLTTEMPFVCLVALRHVTYGPLRLFVFFVFLNGANDGNNFLISVQPS